jgi:hypothetical protein
MDEDRKRLEAGMLAIQKQGRQPEGDGRVGRHEAARYSRGGGAWMMLGRPVMRTGVPARETIRQLA